MGNEPRRYICPRCGGYGQQVAGLWNTVTQKHDTADGVCDGCNGSGYLGVIEPEVNSEAGRRLWADASNLDLDALAAIVQRNDAARIKDAWEHFGPLIERCRRAEEEVRDRGAKLVEEVARIADLTRQRYELLTACVEGGAVLNALWITEHDGSALCVEMKGAIENALKIINPLVAKHASVKGGSDGT